MNSRTVHQITDVSEQPAPARPLVLAFGGCTIDTTMKLIGEHVDSRHYFRQNLLCDMTPVLDVSSFDLQSEEAFKIIEKYAIKLHYQYIKDGRFDAIILECAADHVLNYLRVDGSIIPDIRNDLLIDGGSNISFEHIPALRDAAFVSPYEPEYWALWKSAFTRLYDEILLDHIHNGKKIIFVRRYLCEKQITDAGDLDIASEKIQIRNDDLDKIYRFLDGFDHIHFVDPPRDLAFSSAHSPIWGPWEYHPELEYYHYTAEEILGICAGAEAAATFRTQMRAHSAQERTRAVYLADAREKQLFHMQEQLADLHGSCERSEQRCVQVAGQLDAMEANWAAAKAESAGLASKIEHLTLQHGAHISDLNEERTVLRADVTRLQAQSVLFAAERDRLAARLRQVEARYAPVRRIYKFLRIGRIKRSIMRLRTACRRMPDARPGSSSARSR